MEAHSPQKQPQPEVTAQPKKAEYAETKEDREVKDIKPLPKFDEQRNTQTQAPKPQVIQVVQQEPITKVITQPKLEKFDYKFITKKAVPNKVEPRSLLAQRNSEAKVAYAQIELREEPVAAYEEKVKNDEE